MPRPQRRGRQARKLTCDDLSIRDLLSATIGQWNHTVPGEAFNDRETFEQFVAEHAEELASIEREGRVRHGTT